MNCMDIVDKYLSKLKSNFITEPTKYGCQIITPFMAFNGEPITFYIEEQEGNIRITDGGHTLLDLRTIEINLNSGKEKEIYSEILRLYNIKESNGELIIDSTLEEFSEKLIFYLDALHSMYDLEFFIKPSRRKKFSQIIHEYCDVNDLKHYYLNTIAIGTFEHTIDIMSKDHKNCIQTIGTLAETQPTMRYFTIKKIIPFIELELPKFTNFKGKYNRIVIYDETLEWDKQSLEYIENFSDKYFTWETTKKDRVLEELLTV